MLNITSSMRWCKLSRVRRVLLYTSEGELLPSADSLFAFGRDTVGRNYKQYTDIISKIGPKTDVFQSMHSEFSKQMQFICLSFV